MTEQQQNSSTPNWWRTLVAGMSSLTSDGSNSKHRDDDGHHQPKPLNNNSATDSQSNHHQKAPTDKQELKQVMSRPTDVASATCANSAMAPAALSTHSNAAGKDDDDDSFWGYNNPSIPISSTSDPALSDMLSFFMFSHQRNHPYTGAVCFQLEYPGGDTMCHTVQIVSEEEAEEMEKAEEQKREALRAAKSQSRKRARVLRLTSETSEDTPAIQASDASAAADDEKRCLNWLPAPCVRLLLPSRGQRAVEDADATNSLSTIPSTALPSIPYSPRVLVHSSPTPPSSIPLSVTLSCSRATFFGVYLGELDPIRTVLSGQAKCSGYKYMELMKFGKSFDLRSEKWKEFYRQQRRVEKERKKIMDTTTEGGARDLKKSIGNAVPLTEFRTTATATSTPTSTHARAAEEVDDVRTRQRASCPVPAETATSSQTHSSTRSDVFSSFIRALSTTASVCPLLGSFRSGSRCLCRPCPLPSVATALIRTSTSSPQCTCILRAPKPKHSSRPYVIMPADPATFVSLIRKPSIVTPVPSATPSVPSHHSQPSTITPSPLSVIPRSAPTHSRPSFPFIFGSSSLSELLDEVYDVSRDVWMNSTCTFEPAV